MRRRSDSSTSRRGMNLPIRHVHLRAYRYLHTLQYASLRDDDLDRSRRESGARAVTTPKRCQAQRQPIAACRDSAWARFRCPSPRRAEQAARVRRVDHRIPTRRMLSRLRSVEPSSAIYAKYEPTVRSSALCLYPLFLTTYTYEGHATGSPGDAYHVLVSGKSGKVIGEKHPSALKALARKFRRFLAS